MADTHQQDAVQIMESSLTTPDQFSLFQKRWIHPEPKAVIILTHGIAEHIGRYTHVAEALTAEGYTVVGFDLRGHGKSSGRRNFVDRFQNYLDDLALVLDKTRTDFPGLPVFLFGHSMGGGIVTLFAIQENPDVAGILLSGPSVKVSDDISPLLQKLSGILSVLTPRLPAVKLDSGFISRDPLVVKAYDEDPLCYRGGILARTGAELLKATRTISARMEQINLPILIMHGQADKLADISGSRELYRRVSSQDKTFKAYDGLYHEILNEPEQDQVLADMLNWIAVHS